MIQSGNKHKLKALGLIEVLVVLAIVGTTMIAATQLSLRAFRNIIQDEVEDYATGIALQALELSKSPDSVRVRNASGTFSTFEGSYYANLNANPPFIYQVTSTIQAPPTSCTTSSVYYLNTTALANGAVPIVCLHVAIDQTTNLGQPFYKVTTTVIYVYSGQTTTRSFIGYRRGTFSL